MNADKLPLAVIVGAGPGLGAALATRFAAGGCAIALLSRHADSREAILAQLARDDHPAYGYDCDAGDPASVAAAFWQLHTQPRSAWTQELDLRPSTEHF